MKNALDLTNKEISGLNQNRENLGGAADLCKVCMCMLDSKVWLAEP